jgi:hypothetical protein
MMILQEETERTEKEFNRGWTRMNTDVRAGCPWTTRKDPSVAASASEPMISNHCTEANEGNEERHDYQTLFVLFVTFCSDELASDSVGNFTGSCLTAFRVLRVFRG